MIKIVGKESREIEVEGAVTVAKLATRIGIRLSSYVTLKNGVPVTSDEIVTPDDELTFLEVFSGG